MKKLFLILIVAFATTCGFAQKRITVEYPYYDTINTRIFDISKVIADKEATVLEVYFYAADNITVDANTVLVGNTTSKHYKLLRSEGVEIGQATNLPESGFMKGVLHFEPLDKEDLSFDFDGGNSGWSLKGVSLYRRYARSASADRTPRCRHPSPQCFHPCECGFQASAPRG